MTTGNTTMNPEASPGEGLAEAEQIERIERVRSAAYRIRTNALVQAEVQGQGYIGQALDIADVLAVLYADQLNLRPDEPEWEGRDRCLLSIGHYAIALYAALAEADFIPLDELSTYASDDSRLPMSAMASYTPGVEISGGSLGHGLTVANGVALGLKRKANPAFVYNILSDGELDEGSTWEAAAVAAHQELDNLIAVVDFNNQQADGTSTSVLGMEPIDKKWESFGWIVRRVDGHDVPTLLRTFDELRSIEANQPRCVIVNTTLGKGVPLLESREKLHFMQVKEDEWAQAHQQLKETFQA